jgi:hypothetical protein
MASIITNPDQVPGAASTGYGRQNEQIYAMRTGHIMLGLTGMADTTLPKIADGSVVEVNGAFYGCKNGDETIGGQTALVSGKKNYIYAVPNGDAASFTFLSSGTTPTEPSWNAKKGGWYNGNNRAVARIFYLNGQYYDKIVLDNYAAGASFGGNTPVPDYGGTCLAWYGNLSALPDEDNPPIKERQPGVYTLVLAPGGYRVSMGGADGANGGSGGYGGGIGSQAGNPPDNAGINAPLPSGTLLGPTAPKFVVTEATTLTIEVGENGEAGEAGTDGQAGKSLGGDPVAYGGSGGGGGGGAGGDGGQTRISGPCDAVVKPGKGANGGTGGAGRNGTSAAINTGGAGGAGGREREYGVAQMSGERGEDGFSSSTTSSNGPESRGGRGGRGGLYNCVTTTADYTAAFIGVYKCW